MKEGVKRGSRVRGGGEKGRKEGGKGRNGGDVKGGENRQLPRGIPDVIFG